MKALTLIPLVLLTPLSCAPARGAGTQDSGPPIDPVSGDDADGDGFPASTDCDDSATAVNPAATEDCGNAVDDDCDGHTDGGDAACPLEGEIGTGDADVDLNQVWLDDTRPHSLPTDGTPSLWARGTGSLDWYGFEDALAGTWTLLASVPGEVWWVESLPDIEGDGQTDMLTRIGGAARFGGSPAALDTANAALFVPDATLLGVTSDLDGDGFEDFLVHFTDQTTDAPSVAWFSSASTGVADPLADSLATVEVAIDSDITRVQGFDAEGDGIPETLLTQPGATDSYGGEWYHRGTVYFVTAVPSASTLEGASTAIVREDGWELGVYDAAGVGDLDGDGYDDLAVGYSAKNAQDGSVLLLPGPFEGTHGSADALGMITGLANPTGFSSGDMDADDVPELLVTARRGEADNGVFVFTAPAAGGTADAAHLAILETSETPQLRDARLHDIDADGLDDVLGTLVFYAR